jgi:hypothetical protein
VIAKKAKSVSGYPSLSKIHKLSSRWSMGTEITVSIAITLESSPRRRKIQGLTDLGDPSHCRAQAYQASL